jgi:2-polyprenyl-3-methyl-5-hydroxy-6-metoxy-1,4-benzoquinol methylase
MHQCEGCALIQLIEPVPPELLYSDYVTLSSWKHQPHLPRLIELLAERELAPTASILEVGSNDGGFLTALKDAGYGSALGVEPAQDAREAADRIGVSTIGEYFEVALANHLVAQHGAFDLLVARQVLEHIEPLDEFSAAMAASLKLGSLVLVEVPNFDFALEARDYSAIWEEHVNCFTIDTLARCLASAGVRVLHSETALFSGEILIVLGEYVGVGQVPTDDDHMPASLHAGAAYAADWPATRARLTEYLAEQAADCGAVAVYGGGCRACSLINYAGIAPHIRLVVDDQPEKQGRFMPGSRLPIEPSEALLEEEVSLCLLAVNAENEEKVIEKHKRFIEAGGRFASLHPPSERLLGCLSPAMA